MDFRDTSSLPLRHESEWDHLNRIADENPDDFANWEMLIRVAESIDGGVSRLSSATTIANLRNIYDRFLGRFPLFFGYWKKYADFEYLIGGSGPADKIYERGVASIPYSVDLWTHYCAFKVDTCHEPETVRRVFEIGAEKIGLDYLSHTFWDKYLEFEERVEAWDKLFELLKRIIHIPMHQYARFFEKFSQYAQVRPLEELAPNEFIAQIRSEVKKEPSANVIAGQQQIKMERGDLDIEREIRARIHHFHLEIFNRTQVETTKRWTYESQIKRPYFLVTELDSGQLNNWNRYLDFEEIEGDLRRIITLYERALIPCAMYDFLWMRYTRWLAAQPGLEEATRCAYHRACTIFVPMARPGIRIQFAYYQELCNDSDSAIAIIESVLSKMPTYLEAWNALVHITRRQHNNDRDKVLYAINNAENTKELDYYTKAAIFSIKISMIWKVFKDVETARKMFEETFEQFLDSKFFWINYFKFEVAETTKDGNEERLEKLVVKVMEEARLPPLVVQDIVNVYLIYLIEQSKESQAIQKYFDLDRQVNGPFSVQSIKKIRLAPDGDINTTLKAELATNGHVGIHVGPVSNSTITDYYARYYKDQGLIPQNTI